MIARNIQISLDRMFRWIVFSLKMVVRRFVREEGRRIGIYRGGGKLRDGICGH